MPFQPEHPGLFDPHTHARTTDPDTSHEAAVKLTDKATMLRTLLTKYHRFQFQGLTAEEASGLCGYTASEGAWKRVSDLKRLGWVEDTGGTRRGVSGRSQAVLRITDAGREQLQ